MNNKLKLITGILLAVSLFHIIPYAIDKDIFFGQVGKQVWTAELAQNISMGKVKGIIPYHDFPEVHHKEPVIWAEEFPLYISLTGITSAILRTDIVITSRVWSFIFFLFMIFGAYKLNRFLYLKTYLKGRFVLPLIFGLFPIFRLYASSVVPDLAMGTMLVWGFYYYIKQKNIASYVFFVLACLFKYYAVFFIGGLMIYELFFAKEFLTDKLRRILKLFLTTLPAISYVIYFILADIPNPITEYKEAGHSHLGSSLIFSSKFYSRFVTWTFVKNSSIAGAILAIFGFLRVRIKSDKLILISISLIISLLIFALIFADSYYIHDYYSMSMMILMAFLAAFGLDYLLFDAPKGLQIFGFVLLIGLLTQSISHTRSSQMKMNFYADAANFMKQHIPTKEKIFMLGDRTPGVTFFLNHYQGWTTSEFYFKSFPLIKKSTERLLQEGWPQHVALMFLDQNSQRHQKWLDYFGKYGWNSIKAKKEIPPSNRKTPPALIMILEKASRSEAIDSE